MKKNSSLMIGLSLVLVLSALTGCKSLKKNSGGVYGSGSDDIFGAGSDGMGGFSMSDRFTGGTEHPGLFSPVYFAYDSSEVVSGERTKVEDVAQNLKKNSSYAVIIEGHGDERGSNEYNLALGERRAQAIRSYLISLGIESDRIQTKSYGEEKPENAGHDEASWAANRRGDFVLYY
ncbi:MAG: peptidoglycan-associated lipoprotein Pal [Pontiellaceae bacterium]|nr:peptidoglycan-associated lipoprotein Pal [Pontiellaceae bacterium]